ncbi:L-threonine dehydrogenase [Photorhabdus sp. HUG-39]|uniref:L-threonine dehydrogenase n=1 Tax=Photorhabdus kayaii TaxID=230088 RepID=A0ABX0B0T9_9GAMM|nr:MULTISPECIES: L-threonine dehydrogenase [Photorhabdus]MCC8375919.1 L-threonine dehydrogenase [Photorhabdus bodei]MDB6366504.1 L-threonine dehydrogenase [Photorhabdus bodei]NDL12220.1 L-threonine dehydrogenase [Photorhabdus kayaii]NDL25746.1 L-threonine dehydrogenase [Photorhabdus kayaii]RAX09650.1 L-threonine dehydrogenase [Photorhabdus sp. HUG-39]
MMTTTFFMTSVNMFGAGCLVEAVNTMKGDGYKRALIVTDRVLNEIGVAAKVQALLSDVDIESTVYDGTNPNPTTINVEEGLDILRQHNSDCVISLGGGSPHDCAKAIVLVAANGGDIRDYVGIGRSSKPYLPLISVNTTAGTASEMSRFCVITDTESHIKMAIADKKITPVLSVNDPELMVGMPKGLTAATGMDAMTHAVEAYVSPEASPITDACALKAISMISHSLRQAVADGSNIEARENMAYAQFLAGMAFNSALLGYVHAMSHQLGGTYDLPHGICNAVLLPHVQEFNAKAVAGRLKDIAAAMGVDVSAMNDQQGAAACIAEIRKLSKDIGIPSGLAELNVKLEDLPELATNALKDICCLTNPTQATHEEIVSIFKAAM